MGTKSTFFLLPHSHSQDLRENDENVLTRSCVHYSQSSPEFTSAQKQVDGMISRFVQEATDWKSLASMMAGGVAFRLGKIGLIAGAERGLGSAASRLFPLVQAASAVGGLAVEVTVFEGSRRGLVSFTEESKGNPNLFSWHGKGGIKDAWLSSFVNFGTLKGFGKLAEGQNLLAQHALQDLGMVTGRHVAHGVGFGEKPEGTLADQFVHAELSNLQLGVGTSLAHQMTGERLVALERGLDFPPHALHSGSDLIKHPVSDEAVDRKAALEIARNPFFSPLWMMMGAGGLGSGGPKNKSALQEAQDPTTSQERLKKLAEHHREAVQRVVATNPNTPIDVLTKLGERFPRAFVSNPAIELLRMENTSFYTPMLVKSILGTGDMPTGMLEEMAAHPNSEVRVFVALRAPTPSVLASLARDKTPGVRMAAAQNRLSPVESLRILSEDEDVWVRGKVAENSNTPVELLEALAEDSFEGVRKKVAAHSKAPVAVLEKLAQDAESEVRKAVADNPNSPAVLLETLAFDENPEVRLKFLHHPHVSSSALEILTQSKSFTDRMQVANHQKAPSPHWKHWREIRSWEFAQGWRETPILRPRNWRFSLDINTYKSLKKWRKISTPPNPHGKSRSPR
ncbi:MAG: HEAT repeat domain-containing protein [bacterium]